MQAAAGRSCESAIDHRRRRAVGLEVADDALRGEAAHVGRSLGAAGEEILVEQESDDGQELCRGPIIVLIGSSGSENADVPAGFVVDAAVSVVHPIDLIIEERWGTRHPEVPYTAPSTTLQINHPQAIHALKVIPQTPTRAMH